MKRIMTVTYEIEVKIDEDELPEGCDTEEEAFDQLKDELSELEIELETDTCGDLTGKPTKVEVRDPTAAIEG